MRFSLLQSHFGHLEKSLGPFRTCPKDMSARSLKKTWHFWTVAVFSAALLPREIWSWVYGYVIQWVQGNLLDWVDYWHYHEAVRRFIADPHMLYLARAKTTQIGFLY